MVIGGSISAAVLCVCSTCGGAAITLLLTVVELLVATGTGLATLAVVGVDNMSGTAVAVTAVDGSAKENAGVAVVVVWIGLF